LSMKGDPEREEGSGKGGSLYPKKEHSIFRLNGKEKAEPERRGPGLKVSRAQTDKGEAKTTGPENIEHDVSREPWGRGGRSISQKKKITSASRVVQPCARSQQKKKTRKRKNEKLNRGYLHQRQREREGEILVESRIEILPQKHVLETEGN